MVVVVGTVVVEWRSGPDGPQVVVGVVADFPVGSITPLDLEAKLLGYVPRISDTFDSDVVEIPVFVVHDPVEGLVALYAADPHLGCRVGLASDFPSDTGFDLPAEMAFLNPCHGEKYDRLGRYLAGPSPRGLDRFGVYLEGDDVVVDVAAFEYGPER